MFVLLVHELLEVYDEKDERSRAWFTVEEAKQALVTFKPIHVKYLMAMRQSGDHGGQVASPLCNNDQ